jgi:hypothetical protein
VVFIPQGLRQTKAVKSGENGDFPDANTELITSLLRKNKQGRLSSKMRGSSHVLIPVDEEIELNTRRKFSRWGDKVEVSLYQVLW